MVMYLYLVQVVVFAKIAGERPEGEQAKRRPKMPPIHLDLAATLRGSSNIPDHVSVVVRIALQIHLPSDLAGSHLVRFLHAISHVPTEVPTDVLTRRELIRETKVTPEDRRWDASRHWRCWPVVAGRDALRNLTQRRVAA